MFENNPYLQKFKAYYRKRDRVIAFYVLIVLGIFFLLLAAFVYLVPPTQLDIEFTREIQEERNPAFDAFMKFVSLFGINVFAIGSVVIAALLFWGFSLKREALFIVYTTLASVLTFGIKLLVARPRPTEDLVQVIQQAHNNSFPSGHVVHYVVFFGFLLVLMFRLRNMNLYLRMALSFFFLLMIFSVPFSRVYLGVHWFTDVLAGFFLGIICLAWLLYFYFRKPFELKK